MTEGDACSESSVYCTYLISGELIVSRYVAESITAYAGRFGRIGFCQLHIQNFCMQLTKAHTAKMSCIICY